MTTLRTLSGCVAAVVLLLASSSETPAQVKAASKLPMAVQPDTVASFEAVTIKPNPSGGSGSSSGYGHGDTYTATNTTIKSLLQWAFQLPTARIVGGPKWLETAHFDVNAKMDRREADRIQALPWNDRVLETEAMVQRLLVDRFQMKTHWEESEQPVFALVVAKGGSKLRPATDAQRGSSKSTNYGRISATGVKLTGVAELLTQGAGNELGRMVVDRTGMDGVFDFDLKWTPDNGGPTTANTPEAENSALSIFTAVQEQLGLKLESTKAPVKVLVVDRLEMPSQN
ncbi:MAG TPA: TIGR03435 family protein [Acidobacteriaceae bacterium]|nr:TIGR03435 family protein [Acidobacteriaceae bacterium]